MLNEEKVKIMTELAMYEKGEGKKYLPVSRYYRSDYIGLALIKNFFLVTIGYALILAGLAAYFAEYLMNNIHKMNLVNLGIYVILGYVALLVFIPASHMFSIPSGYHRAKKSVKNYYIGLTKLEKMYDREEKKTAGRTKAGGYRK